jgi:hypothetical protein
MTMMDASVREAEEEGRFEDAKWDWWDVEMANGQQQQKQWKAKSGRAWTALWRAMGKVNEWA